MRGMTIRGLDERLERYLRELARERGISLNQAAILVLRRGAGLEPLDLDERSGPVGDALDEFVGCWTPEEAQDLMDAIQPFEQIDPELWR